MGQDGVSASLIGTRRIALCARLPRTLPRAGNHSPQLFSSTRVGLGSSGVETRKEMVPLVRLERTLPKKTDFESEARLGPIAGNPAMQEKQRCLSASTSRPRHTRTTRVSRSFSSLLDLNRLYQNLLERQHICLHMHHGCYLWIASFEVWQADK